MIFKIFLNKFVSREDVEVGFIDFASVVKAYLTSEKMLCPDLKHENIYLGLDYIKQFFFVFL